MPRRRCAGCGRIAPKSELTRLALARAGGAGRPRAVLDRAGTMPGRGAYVCRGALGELPAATCLALAGRRGALSRALRCAVTIDPELIESVGI